MEFPVAMMHDSVWFERPSYEASREHYEMYLTNNLTLQVSKPHEEQGLFSRATTAVAQTASKASSALVSEIAEIRDTIKQSLTGMAHTVASAVTAESDEHISSVEKENKELRQLVEDLVQQVKKLDARVTVLEANAAKQNAKIPSSEPPAKKAKVDDGEQETKEADKKEETKSDDDDLFGSDDDDEETEEERIAAEKKRAALAKYAAKKSKKPAVIAKSSILLDIKPWDDETDMAAMEKCVRTIEMDGLLWGAGKLVPLAYGIKKLQINCVVEDDKVGTDILEEEITKFEDYVQSVDIAAFNKI